MTAIRRRSCKSDWGSRARALTRDPPARQRSNTQLRTPIGLAPLAPLRGEGLGVRGSSRVIAFQSLPFRFAHTLELVLHEIHRSLSSCYGNFVNMHRGADRLVLLRRSKDL
jgi:hypothetical protein